MICNYNFLLSYGDDPVYSDAREFTHPYFRDAPRSPSWVLQKMREGLQKCDLLPSGSKLDHATARKIQGGRLADATRLPGERALRCEECNEKFGGKTVFKAHRKYGTKRGRPARDAILKCYSLEGTKYKKDLLGVWRNDPKFD